MSPWRRLSDAGTLIGRTHEAIKYCRLPAPIESERLAMAHADAGSSLEIQQSDYAEQRE
jgi:hypothetical protein